VRFHAAAKDYVDMVTIFQKDSNIHATFNLTPSVLRRIDAFNNGTRDNLWEVTLLPANQLADEQKTYIFEFRLSSPPQRSLAGGRSGCGAGFALRR
jgi:alpha-amylase/alpha-mannosidase (GH57 family)